VSMKSYCIMHWKSTKHTRKTWDFRDTICVGNCTMCIVHYVQSISNFVLD